MSHRRSDEPRSRNRLGLWLAFLAAMGGSADSAAADGVAAPATLRERFEAAEKLPATDEGRAQAAAAYREILEIHRGNEVVGNDALRALVRCQLDSGSVEEAIRVTVGWAIQQGERERESAVRELLQQLSLKYPDAWKKVLQDMDLAGSRPTAPSLPAPDEDLSKSILQRDDAALRERALEKLLELLGPEAPDAARVQALVTLSRSLTARFDRDPFLQRVRPLLAAENPQLRSLAVSCLPGLEANAADLDLLVPLAGDPDAQVRAGVAGALIQIAKGGAAETVVPALTRLLRDQDRDVVEQTVRSMWGQYGSPEFDPLLIELSRDPRLHHNVIYFCLSTQRAKSAAVCRRLVEELADPDWNNSGRAAWGLTYGVSEEAKTLVEEGLLKALPEETNAYTRGQEFRALRGVATEASRPYLTQVSASALEDEETRRTAREILADLDRRR